MFVVCCGLAVVAWCTMLVVAVLLFVASYMLFAGCCWLLLYVVCSCG